MDVGRLKIFTRLLIIYFLSHIVFGQGSLKDLKGSIIPLDSFLEDHTPELYINNSIYRNRLTNAEKGSFVWHGANYRFLDIPRFLDTAQYFKTPETIPEGSEIKILIHRPTTIYICSTFWNAYSYKDSFANDGWISLPDEAVSIESPDKHRLLKTMWKKTFEEFQLTVVKLPTSAKSFVGVIFIKDLSGLSYMVPRRCAPPDPSLDYFIPDPEPKAPPPAPVILDYIEETCIKLTYLCSSNLPPLEYQACLENQKYQVKPSSVDGILSLKAKNCSVQFMKYAEFINQVNLEEIGNYAGCIDVTMISCTCNTEDCANQFLSERLQEASNENIKDEDIHLSYFIIVFVILIAFVLSVFIFILICLLFKYCLLSSPDELYL